jgi:hypothetical protein
MNKVIWNIFMTKFKAFNFLPVLGIVNTRTSHEIGNIQHGEAFTHHFNLHSTRAVRETACD